MVDNFRCTKSIADVANTLISNNTDRYNKNIAAHKDGMPVWFYDLKNNPSDIGIIIGSLLKNLNREKLQSSAGKIIHWISLDYA